MDLSVYITKTVPFKFRGINLSFDLSQGLFSCADIDYGTRLLLKVFSKALDQGLITQWPIAQDAAEEKASACSVLDAGCGVGVIGICAAAALMAMEGAKNSLTVRTQDRDELARLFTAHNAKKNRIPQEVLQAFCEPLLAGPQNKFWDLIFCNIPAKAGLPVLEDFVSRSLALLNSGGKVIIVVVHTLDDFFRRHIIRSEAEIFLEEKSPEYSVFVYGKKTGAPVSNAANQIDEEKFAPIKTGEGFFESYPFYARTFVESALCDIPLKIKSIHGAPGFDSPGGKTEAAVKLIHRTGLEKLNLVHNKAAARMLVHEPDQGFFHCWLLELLCREFPCKALPSLVLSGRNILALEAARHNTGYVTGHKNARPEISIELIPAAGLWPVYENLQKAANNGPPHQYDFIAAFPEFIQQSLLPKKIDPYSAFWEPLPKLLTAGGAFICAFSSVNAERFDRVKPAGFKRLGDIKRKGFRALGYVRIEN